MNNEEFKVRVISHLKNMREELSELSGKIDDMRNKMYEVKSQKDKKAKNDTDWWW